MKFMKEFRTERICKRSKNDSRPRGCVSPSGKSFYGMFITGFRLSLLLR